MEPPVVPPRPLDGIFAANATNDLNASDTGNTKLFVRSFKDIIRFAPETKTWYIWSGTHWEPDALGHIFELTEQTVMDIREIAATLPDEGHDSPRAAMLRHAMKTESEGSRRRIISMAESSPELVIQQDELDVAHNLLACPNGTVNLDTGDVVPSHPEHMNTACCRVSYHPAAKSRELDRYLATFMSDEEDQAVLFGILGTALRGGNVARLLPLFLGASTSGKSQLIAAVAKVLRGYATTANVSIFRGNLDDKPRPDLVRIMRTRIAYANEAAQSWELHADQVKRLTGGDTVAYRNLYAQVVEAVPLFTPIIVANEMPRVKGADDAFRRRMIVIRFAKSLLNGSEDIRIRERFVNDEDCLRALLARMVDGARSQLFVNGVNWSLLPDRFALAMMDAFDDVDHVGSFLLWMTEQEHIVRAEPDEPAVRCVKASDLHAWYSFWVQKHGDRQDREGKLNMRNFGTALRSRGWEAKMAAGTRWVGWRLQSDANWL